MDGCPVFSRPPPVAPGTKTHHSSNPAANAELKKGKFANFYRRENFAVYSNANANGLTISA
jgi:hypothetical protein